MASKTKVVAFAYDNPVFDQGLTRSPRNAPEQVTAIDVKSLKGPENNIQEIIYPDADKLVTRLKWSYYILYLLIIGHIILIGYTDPLYNVSLTVQALVVSVQVGFFLAIMMAFFVATSNTVFIRLGRYDKYLKEFWFFYALFMVELAFVIAVKVYYIVQLSQDASHLSFWHSNIYLGLWLAQRFVMLLFWITAAYSAGQIFSGRAYDPDYLLGL